MDVSGADSSALWAAAKAGGCARKLGALLVLDLTPWGHESDLFMDDAAVVRVGQDEIVQSIDFVTPMVPDAKDFGRVAAANAVSDVFVSGARPMFALAVACVPDSGPGYREFGAALSSARDYLAQVGCDLVGGHPVVDPEAKLGFAVTGRINQTGKTLGRGAQVGDSLLLTKPIGVGILASAFKSGAIGRAALQLAVDTMVAPNDSIPRLKELYPSAIHAATDVTGFGLVGHVGELCKRSRVGARLSLEGIPTLAHVSELAALGVATSVYRSNMEYISSIHGANLARLDRGWQIVLTDPQTSGGAIIAVAAEAVDQVLLALDGWGVTAAVVGETTRSEGIRLA